MRGRIGHRTTLAVPLLRDGLSIGAILIRRLEVRPFTDAQINLLQTFAIKPYRHRERALISTNLTAPQSRSHRGARSSRRRRVIFYASSASTPTDVQAGFDDAIVRKWRTVVCGCGDALLCCVEGGESA